MSNETDLIVIEKQTVLSAFSEKDGLAVVIDSARAEVESFQHDMTTQAGRDRTRSLARRVSSLKVTLDDMGKDLVSEWKEKSKAVDANRKQMRDALDELKIEARAPLTAFEQVEKDRVDGYMSIISLLESLGKQADNDGSIFSLAQLNANLDSLANTIVDDSFKEFELSATKTKAKSIAAVTGFIEAEEKRLTEAAELERLRAAEEARAQKERDEHLKREAAEAARIEAEIKAEAERQRVANEAKAEREAAERRELELKLAAEKSERERVEAEQRAANAVRETEERLVREAKEKAAAEAAEQAKRDANKKHVAAINNEALQGFVENGFTAGQAKTIVTLIAKGIINNVSIKY